MIISESAKIYAQALIKQANNDMEKLNFFSTELDKVDNLIKSSKELSSVLNAPIISADKKSLVIDDIFSAKISIQILNLLKILAEKSKIALLEQITEAFNNELDNVKNIKRVTIISAVDLNDTQKNKIIEKLSNKLSKDIIASWQIDYNIIGGLIINYDNTVIDTSIKNKLEKIKRSI